MDEMPHETEALLIYIERGRKEWKSDRKYLREGETVHPCLLFYKNIRKKGKMRAFGFNKLFFIKM